MSYAEKATANGDGRRQNQRRISNHRVDDNASITYQSKRDDGIIVIHPPLNNQGRAASLRRRLAQAGRSSSRQALLIKSLAVNRARSRSYVIQRREIAVPACATSSSNCPGAHRQHRRPAKKEYLLRRGDIEANGRYQKEAHEAVYRHMSRAGKTARLPMLATAYLRMLRAYLILIMTSSRHRHRRLSFARAAWHLL